MAICRGPQYEGKVEERKWNFQVATRSVLSHFQEVGTHVPHHLLLLHRYLWTTEGLAKLGTTCGHGQDFAPGD